MGKQLARRKSEGRQVEGQKTGTLKKAFENTRELGCNNGLFLTSVLLLQYIISGMLTDEIFLVG